MSVVNKMLNDLDKRNASGGQTADYVPSKAGNNNTVVIVLIGMLITLAIILIWLTMREPDALRMPSEQAPQIVEVDTKTQLGQQTMPNAINNVSLAGEIKNSQLQAPSSIPEGQIMAGDVKVVLDGETMEELVQRIQTPSGNPQTLGPSNNAAVVARASQQQAHKISPEVLEKTKVMMSVKNVDSSAMPQDGSVQSSATKLPSSMSVSTHQNSTLSVEHLERDAYLAMQSGNKALAIKNLYSVLEIAPRNLNARKKLSSLLFAQGQSAQASELLAQGIKLAPSDSSMRLMQARLLFRTDNVEQALGLLKQHPIGVLPDDDLLSFRAALADKQGDYAQSLLDYQQLLIRQPDTARWWLGLGVSQDKQGQTQKATTSYKNVKRLNQLSEQVLAFVEQRLAALEG